MVHLYNEILLGPQNNISSFVTTWIDPEGIVLSEISQTKKDKYHMISLICKIQKNKINKQNRNRLIGTENKLIVARWEGF